MTFWIIIAIVLGIAILCSCAPIIVWTLNKKNNKKINNTKCTMKEEEIKKLDIYAILGLIAIHKAKPELRKIATFKTTSDAELHEKVKNFFEHQENPTAKKLYTRILLTEDSDELMKINDECAEAMFTGLLKLMGKAQ